MTTGLIGFDNS